MTELLDFLSRSPSRYHAVANLAQELEQNGYTQLYEGRDWALAPGGKYYVTRNGSALTAFRIPGRDFSGFMISASHSDAPCLRVKENAEPRPTQGPSPAGRGTGPCPGCPRPRSPPPGPQWPGSCPSPDPAP